MKNPIIIDLKFIPKECLWKTYFGHCPGAGSIKIMWQKELRYDGGEEPMNK